MSDLLTKSLTERECDVLRRLAKGQHNKQIADVYGVHVNTVQHHIMHARNKLKAENTIHAVAIAICAGVIE